MTIFRQLFLLFTFTTTGAVKPRCVPPSPDQCDVFLSAQVNSLNFNNVSILPQSVLVGNFKKVNKSCWSTNNELVIFVNWNSSSCLQDGFLLNRMYAICLMHHQKGCPLLAKNKQTLLLSFDVLQHEREIRQNQDVVSACCELGYRKAFETGISTFCFGLTFSSEPQCNNEAQQCCECCHTSLRKLDAGQICTDDGVAGAQCKIITKRCCENKDKQMSSTTTLFEPKETTNTYMTSQFITTIVPTSILSALCVPTVSVVQSSVLTVSPTPLRPAVSGCCELGYRKAFETGLSTFCFGLTFSSEPQCNNEAQQCCECCHTSLRKLDAGQICTDDGVAGAQCKIITKRCCSEDPEPSTTKISITTTSYECILSSSVTVSPTPLRLEPAYVIGISDDQTAINGSTVTIECIAGGIPSVFTYEWMKNGVTIPGQTGSTLTISSVTTSDIGEYKCTPSNSNGNTNSSSSILSVNVPLAINGLVPQTIFGFVPSAPNGYVIIPFNSKIILTLSGDLITMVLGPVDSGTYNITSFDFNGAIVVLTLTVYEPAYVISISDDQTAINGSTVTIECIAGGIPSVFTYEWMKNGVTNPGQTGSTLTISSVTTSDIGEYKCTPSNSNGNTNSSSSILSVNVPLAINGLVPQTIFGFVPSAPNGYVIIPFNSKINLTLSGDLITMVLGPVDSGTYNITSPDFNGAIVVLTLTVYEPAYVISISDDQTAINGSTVTIECIAGGIPSVFTYEWMKNGVTIPGQTGSTLTISSVTTSDIGEYKCTPSNSRGNTYSCCSILSVKVPLTINGLVPQTISGLVPSAPNGYVIIPFNFKINLTLSGDLITMVLSPVDSGTYTITSPDFNGARIVLILTVHVITIVPTSISSALCVPTVSVIQSSVLTVSPTPLRPAVSACCELGYRKAFETGVSTFCFGLTFSSEPQCNNEAQQCCECCHTSLRKLDAGQICTDDGVAGAQCKIITKRCCGEDPEPSTTKITITTTSYECILLTNVETTMIELVTAATEPVDTTTLAPRPTVPDTLTTTTTEPVHTTLAPRPTVPDTLTTKATEPVDTTLAPIPTVPDTLTTTTTEPVDTTLTPRPTVPDTLTTTTTEPVHTTLAPRPTVPDTLTTKATEPVDTTLAPRPTVPDTLTTKATEPVDTTLAPRPTVPDTLTTTTTEPVDTTLAPTPTVPDTC